MFSSLLPKKRNKRRRIIPTKRRLGQFGRRPLYETLEKRELLSTVAWNSGPQLPAPRSEAVALLGPDNAVVVLGGETSGDPRNVPKLASGAAFWTSGHDLELERVGHGAVRTPGSGVFVYGGVDGNEASDEVLHYDYYFGDSQDGDKLSVERSEFGFVADDLARAYAIGGLDKEANQVLSSAERYDASEDLWTSIASLPSARHSTAAVSDDAGHLYVFGGSSTTQAGNIENSSFRYTVATGTWDSVAPMPIATQDSAAVYAGDGTIYVIGGQSAAGTVATVQTYDPASDTWDTTTDLPAALHSHTATVDDLGKIIVVGGKDFAGTTVASVYRSQRLDIPDSAPVITSNPNENGLQDAAYSYNVGATGNPAPTFTLSTAPAGMTIDEVTGLISWIPGPSQLGDNPVTTTATSQAGSVDQSFTVNVLTGTKPVFTSNPNANGSIDSFYSYDANATAYPDPTFMLSAAPAGMTIDSATGFISWQPLPGQKGVHPVTVTATNRADSTDQSFVIDVLGDTTPPTAPTLLTVDGTGTTTVDLSWAPATDNFGVDHYEILKGRRCGWRGRNTCYSVIQTDIASTSTTLTGLEELTSFKLVVRAVDAEGNHSTNSNQVIATTQSAPTIRYYQDGAINGEVQATANFPLEVRLTAAANPAPTYAKISGPATLNVDPTTGLVAWTPTAGDVGMTTVVIEATNSVGSSQISIPINVAADLPVVSYQFNPNGGGARLGLPGELLEIQVIDSSNTPSTFELFTAPSEMTIDPNSGLISWTPTVADAGPTTLTVRATNSAGSTERTIEFLTYFTGSVSDIAVTGLVDQLNPTLTWTAPTGLGAEDVAGYSIQLTTRYRRGRAWRTERINFDSPGTATSIDLTGLTIGRTYKVYVNAYNADGEKGLFSSEQVEFRSTPALPIVSRTVQNPNGGPIVANQPIVIQLTDSNPDPSTLELVSGPANLTFNTATGLATWTPTAAQVGQQTVTFRATNSVGPRDVVVGINVLFTGPVTNISAVRAVGTNQATVTWTAPTDNVEPIAHYRITQHWKWSSRRRTRTIIVPATDLSATVFLSPTGAVWHRGVTVTPVSESGLWGPTSLLTPYS
ncbi:putative Ig domain-containing protein [Adhaeretor mobilis]|uniref:N-acetylneuraminate epimerase n=1 Tax=Adhaeretor mobilis TaxID=1930276 RepID=A0A517MS05_9BACT|nr:putative Ig domain-containing protein [Adhaeretor mobilis]QDS97663.1 N-acetylneuraminate epimerase [Adhaeretor mobilis]